MDESTAEGHHKDKERDENPTADVIRDHLVSVATHFLRNARVQDSPLSQKRAFPVKKGLNDTEIDVAIASAAKGSLTITCIPRVVSDALRTMEIKGEPPSWKIMDNRGNVTVVLHWDSRSRFDRRDGKLQGSWPVVVTSQPPFQSSAQTYQTVTSKQSSSVSPSSSMSRAKLTLEGLGPRPSQRTLPIRKPTLLNGHGALGLEDDDDDESDDEKTEREISPTHDHSQCDFHCAALHRDGAQIHVNKSVATSPIQESMVPMLPPMSASVDKVQATGAIPKKPAVKGHVRFMDIEPPKITNGSDSETETTEKEEELLCERYLLLTDQLSVDQDRHLSVRDIGIILERLNSKIVDVDKLEREKESPDCYNWIIKATIKGEVLREIGVIYNGQYYGIMEHPGYF